MPSRSPRDTTPQFGALGIRELRGLRGGIQPSTGASQFDEAEFLVGGSPGRGEEMEKVSFKIFSGYVMAARKQLSEHVLPYGKSGVNMSDWARHAYVRHVAWVDSVMPGMDHSIIHQLHQIEETVAYHQFKLKFQASIEEVAKTISQQLEMPGGKDQVARMLGRMRHHIRLMDESTPDNRYYKSMYERMFSDRFGAYERAGLVLLEGGEGDARDEASADEWMMERED